MNLRGTVTALITPFKEHKVDEKGLIQNIRYQIAQGISGILPLGTTGEASTLSPQEHERIITLAVEEARGKVPVWVGTGSYCTKTTIEKTQRAKDLGADVALVVSPYYNKPTQEGIFRHFEAVTKAVDLPIVVYNIPGRCGVNIETSTLKRISELPNIVGVKESSANVMQAADVFHQIAEKHPNFSLLSGDDAFTLPMMSLGAVGAVSVVSNLVPAQIIALTNAALEGDFAKAREIHYQLLPLYKVAFIESNPVPIKTAMNLCGMAAGTCRLPLYEMVPDNVNILRRVLGQMRLMEL